MHNGNKERSLLWKRMTEFCKMNLCMGKKKGALQFALLGSVLLDERLEGLDRPLAAELLHLLPLLVEVQRGEPVDALRGAELLVLVVIRRAVHLGHRHVGGGGKLAGQ